MSQAGVFVPRRFLVIVLLLGLGLRLSWCWSQRDAPLPVANDAVSYISLANHLLAGDGFVDSSANLGAEVVGASPTAFWSPVYPLFLAGHLAVFGSGSYTAVRVSQSLISVLGALLVCLLAHRYFGMRAAKIALVLAACYPQSIFYANLLTVETLYFTIVVGFVYVVLRYVDRPTITRAIALGFIAGLGYFTSALFAACVIATMLFLAIRRALGWRDWPRLLAAAATFLLLAAPWAARNARLFGAPFIGPTKDGFNLLLGNNDNASGTYSPLAAEYRAMLQGRSELERQVLLRGIAVTWIHDHPRAFMSLALGKFVRLWTPFPNVNRTAFRSAAQLASYGVILLCALLVPFACRSTLSIDTIYPYLIFGAQSCVVAVYISAGRFRFPLDGLLIALSAGTVAALANRFPPGASVRSRSADVPQPLNCGPAGTRESPRRAKALAAPKKIGERVSLTATPSRLNDLCASRT